MAKAESVLVVLEKVGEFLEILLVQLVDVLLCGIADFGNLDGFADEYFDRFAVLEE